MKTTVSCLLFLALELAPVSAWTSHPAVRSFGVGGAIFSPSTTARNMNMFGDWFKIPQEQAAKPKPTPPPAKKEEVKKEDAAPAASAKTSAPEKAEDTASVVEALEAQKKELLEKEKDVNSVSAPAEEGAVLQGSCRWFNSKRGFGMVTSLDNKEEYFVHQSDIVMEGFRKLTPGDKVTFSWERDSQGRTKAVNVTPE